MQREPHPPIYITTTLIFVVNTHEECRIIDIDIQVILSYTLLLCSLVCHNLHTIPLLMIAELFEGFQIEHRVGSHKIITFSILNFFINISKIVLKLFIEKINFLFNVLE